jgi:hypothetical protein
MATENTEPAGDPTDTQILDWIADARLFDGVGDADIDDVCASMLSEDNLSEDAWKLMWRKAMRQVLIQAMDTPPGVPQPALKKEPHDRT